MAADPLLAPYFARVDMREHVPRIADFWSTIIFHTGRYSGNAFRPHLEMPGLTAAHFERWVETLERTVDARVEGPHADAMKALGHRIAYSMQVRLGIYPRRSYYGSPAARAARAASTISFTSRSSVGPWYGTPPLIVHSTPPAGTSLPSTIAVVPVG